MASLFSSNLIFQLFNYLTRCFNREKNWVESFLSNYFIGVTIVCLWTGLWSSGELGRGKANFFFPKQRACSQATPLSDLENNFEPPSEMSQANLLLMFVFLGSRTMNFLKDTASFWNFPTLRHAAICHTCSALRRKPTLLLAVRRWNV